jgi:hypothetical protein
MDREIAVGPMKSVVFWRLARDDGCISDAQGLFVNVLGMSVVRVVALLRHSEPVPSSIASLGSVSADHLQALIEVARRRRAEPVTLDERAVDITLCK